MSDVSRINQQRIKKEPSPLPTENGGAPPMPLPKPPSKLRKAMFILTIIGVGAVVFFGVLFLFVKLVGGQDFQNTLAEYPIKPKFFSMAYWEIFLSYLVRIFGNTEQTLIKAPLLTQGGNVPVVSMQQLKQTVQELPQVPMKELTKAMQALPHVNQTGGGQDLVLQFGGFMKKVHVEKKIKDARAKLLKAM